MSTPPQPTHRLITFLQYCEPPLKAGEYTITVHQTAPSQPPPNDFSATRRFAVAGERFQLDPAEIVGVFPPNLADGEFAGTLPHVLFSRQTLPWERSSVASDPAAPWLAVLLFDDEQAPTPVKRAAKDLAAGPITVAGSSVTATGKLPAGYASYPQSGKLDYGETPDDPCMTIDVDAELFSSIAPTAADLHYLAHVRETDTVDLHDTVHASNSQAVVLGNRVPQEHQRSHAYLVSLEQLDTLLPATDGTKSSQLTATTVRLVTFRWWTFTASTSGETLARLLCAVNSPPVIGQTKRLTSLQVPYAGPRPDRARVRQAVSDQAAGNLAPGDAAVLARNAFAMGYLPLGHQLRRGGQTVSWYRGPLAPSAVTTKVATPISCPDAANRYDPQTGMLDVSYGAAWQLGKLLALQNESFAMTLYNWRREAIRTAAVAREHQLIANLLGGSLESVTGARAARLTAPDAEPPEQVVRWLARLSLLNGVPFNYLVPDERMLPPESLRAFHVDRAWIDALRDGALSIGRATSGEQAFDAQRLPATARLVDLHARQLRPNPSPASPGVNATGEITGFLLRSQAVAGWPHLNVLGYADAERQVELPKLRLERLSSDVMLCLFDGVLDRLVIREAAGALHCGVEGPTGAFTTTLREVDPPAPGKQYASASAPVTVRADKRTLSVATAAEQIAATLNAAPYGQTFEHFTSAEFALQMIKGVVEVEFARAG